MMSPHYQTRKAAQSQRPRILIVLRTATKVSKQQHDTTGYKGLSAVQETFLIPLTIILIDGPKSRKKKSSILSSSQCLNYVKLIRKRKDKKRKGEKASSWVGALLGGAVPVSVLIMPYLELGALK